MKVLVGGGTGFIGAALVRKLRRAKDAARVITRDPVKAAFELGQEVDAVAPGADPKTLARAAPTPS